MLKPISDKIRKTSGMGACILALFFIGSLFIIASGGGGDGGGGAPAESATLTEDTADNAAGAVMQTTDLAGPGALMGSTPMAETSASHSPIRAVIDRALELAPTASSSSDGRIVPAVTETCTNGGTVTFPDDLTDAQMQNAVSTGSVTMSMGYDNCIEGNETIDGDMTLTITGNFSIVGGELSLDSPESMTIATNSFYYANSAEGDEMTMTNLEMAITDPTFDASDEMTAATVTMNGDMSGTTGGQDFSAGFYDLVVTFEDQDTGESLTIDGMLNNPCIGGWATVSTTTALFIPNAADCPTAGDFSIKSGDNIVRVQVASDSKVTVYYNGTPDANSPYADCSAVEGACQ